MLRVLIAALLLAVAAPAANVRLYLKDGTYQIAREYQIQADRVRFYSVERSQWEEIPLDLVDLKRTKAEIAERQVELEKEAKAVSAEERVERQQEAELAKIPVEAGVYFDTGKQVKPLKQAESKVVTNRRRSVLKVITPVPVLAGKATVELDGERSETVLHSDRPEFYFRLAAEERFGIIRLAPKKDARIVEKWSIVPISKQVFEEMDEVEIFRRQLGDGLYKIWPVDPLKPGEYAVVEYTEGQQNIQVWDFGCYPPSQP